MKNKIYFFIFGKESFHMKFILIFVAKCYLLLRKQTIKWCTINLQKKKNNVQMILLYFYITNTAGLIYLETQKVDLVLPSLILALDKCIVGPCDFFWTIRKCWAVQNLILNKAEFSLLEQLYVLVSAKFDIKHERNLVFWNNS